MHAKPDVRSRTGRASPPAHAMADVASHACRRAPLALIEQDLTALRRGVARLTAGDGVTAPAWRAVLQRVQMHLFLTASQLLPLWRDMCRDSRCVDRAEVRLALLNDLTTQTLDAGADDPLTEARLDLLLEALEEEQLRTAALLRALDAIVEPDALHALVRVWTDEGQRLATAQRQGLPVVMDNEDADPVGAPPR